MIARLGVSVRNSTLILFNAYSCSYNELFVIPKLTYLGPAADGYSVKQFLQDYLSFLILFNYLIPISLYVTIELQRVIGGFFMEWDTELYEKETDQQCVVNTSNLNEELGQINILFSDKTGTLTKNEMNFQQCSIAGKKFTYKKTRLEDDETKALIDINKFTVSQHIAKTHILKRNAGQLRVTQFKQRCMQKL